MLDWRFSGAPMMDWIGTSQKSERAIVARHTVPNAVLAFDARQVANKIRLPAAIGGCGK
jgi:hypothetical protein